MIRFDVSLFVSQLGQGRKTATTATIGVISAALNYHHHHHGFDELENRRGRFFLCQPVVVICRSGGFWNFLIGAGGWQRCCCRWLERFFSQSYCWLSGFDNYSSEMWSILYESGWDSKRYEVFVVLDFSRKIRAR